MLSTVLYTGEINNVHWGTYYNTCAIFPGLQSEVDCPPREMKPSRLLNKWPVRQCIKQCELLSVDSERNNSNQVHVHDDPNTYPSCRPVHHIEV